MFSIISGQNGIPVEPGRKAVWEAVWHAGRDPIWVEIMKTRMKPDVFFKITGNKIRAVFPVQKVIHMCICEYVYGMYNSV